LTLREEHRLRVLENRMLRKRDEVTGGGENCITRSVVICTLRLIRIIKPRRMRWAGHIARMAGKRNEYKLLVEKPEGKRPLGRPRRR
jgi:hypothetical protein